MTRLHRAKQERIIEAVRHGFEGVAAVEFVRESGYAMSPTGIARNLASMGGRGKILELIAAGKSNHDILELCYPEDDLSGVPVQPPSQSDLFKETPETPLAAMPFSSTLASQFETTKMTIVVPNELYHALKIASRAEGKSRNDLIAEILTSALSRMTYTGPDPEETD